MKPVVLTILDGWGYSKTVNGNAIANSGTPVLDEILHNYPSTLLQASGPAVGMTFGESGNSEVGHMTLGAGRIIFQYLTRINKSIKNGEFFSNSTLLEAAIHSKTNNSTFHIIGLLTSGAVHAHIDHLVALVKFAKDNGLNHRLHLFTDGRDSGLKEARETLAKLSDELKGLENLATIIGRDFSMDRNNNWQKTETTYNLLTKDEGKTTEDIFKTLDEYYAQDLHDGSLPPTVINKGEIKDNDSIVFFNFREDSMRQITQVFTDQSFDKFARTLPDNLYVSAMTKYTESPNLHSVFSPPEVKNCLSEVLSENNKKHFHIAETEKYAHITFFFNGLQNKSFDKETDLFIESIENPIQNPEMRAMDIAHKVCEELDKGEYDFYVLNIANGDILAHLGNLEAATKGVKIVDQAIGLIKDKVLEKDGCMLITADHGNVESMIYKNTGAQETKHDDNPVPLYLIAKKYEAGRSLDQISESLNQPSGLLADVAPTILEIMEINKPVEMTGQSLLQSLLSESEPV